MLSPNPRPAISESVTASEVASPRTPKLAGPSNLATRTLVNSCMGLEKIVPARTHLLELVMLGLSSTGRSSSNDLANIALRTAELSACLWGMLKVGRELIASRVGYATFSSHRLEGGYTDRSAGITSSTARW